MIYNYVPFNTTYAYGNYQNIAPTERFHQFGEAPHIVCDYTLTDLPYSQYHMKEYILNSDHGSSYDNWVSMGAVSVLDSDNINYLNHISMPSRQLTVIDVNQKSYRLNKELAPLEIRFIDLSPII